MADGPLAANAVSDAACTPRRFAKFGGWGAVHAVLVPWVTRPVEREEARPCRDRWGFGSADRRSFDRRLRSGTPPASVHRTGFGSGKAAEERRSGDRTEHGHGVPASAGGAAVPRPRSKPAGGKRCVKSEPVCGSPKSSSRMQKCRQGGGQIWNDEFGSQVAMVFRRRGRRVAASATSVNRRTHLWPIECGHDPLKGVPNIQCLASRSRSAHTSDGTPTGFGFVEVLKEELPDQSHERWGRHWGGRVPWAKGAESRCQGKWRRRRLRSWP